MLCQFLINFFIQIFHHTLSLSSSLVENRLSTLTVMMVMYIHINYNVKLNSLYFFLNAIFEFCFLGYDVCTLACKLTGNNFIFHNMWNPSEQIQKWAEQVLPRLQWKSIMWILYRISSQRSSCNPSEFCLIWLLDLYNIS